MNNKPVSSDDFILLIREVAYHPDSYLKKLVKRFETPSVIRVTRKEELRKYRSVPLFSARYLVIFEDLRILQENYAFIRFNLMFPVLMVETKSQLDDAIFYLNNVKQDFKIYYNDFSKENAMTFIYGSAKEKVSESFCKAIIRQVGLSPLRIITALSVCDQMGYSVKNVEQYVDKYVYIDVRKVIDALLGVPRSKAAMRSAFLYLQLNRHWYKYVKDDIVEELSTIFKIYKDKLSGVLRKENLFSYLEEMSMTRAQVLYALSLFDRVSISSILSMREFIKTASLMEVALLLS